MGGKMDVFNLVCRYFPSDIRKEAEAFSRFRPIEIRVRAGRKTKVIWIGGEGEAGEAVLANDIASLISRMLDHSVYAWEDELGQGFFTLPFGVRVGVSGIFTMEKDKARLVQASSILIRIARENKGCASQIFPYLVSGGKVNSTILLSPPGMGKTTLLRDACRRLSDEGWEIAVVDERGEIAAMKNGEAQLDAGERTDVLEGLTKAHAIPRLIRSMSPDVVVVDEIGSRQDAEAISEAARMGVAVLASAHASGVSDALSRNTIGDILLSGVFQTACVLGGFPGNLRSVYAFSEGKWHLKLSSEEL